MTARERALVLLEAGAGLSVNVWDVADLHLWADDHDNPAIQHRAHRLAHCLDITIRDIDALRVSLRELCAAPLDTPPAPVQE